MRNELLLHKALLAQAEEPPTIDPAPLHTRETHSVSFSATRSQSTPSTYEEEYSEDATSEDDTNEGASEGESEEDNDLDPVEEMNRIVARTRLKHGF